MTTPQDPNQPQGWGQQQPGSGGSTPQGGAPGATPGVTPGATPQGSPGQGQPPQGQQPWGAAQPQQGQPWGQPGAAGQSGQPGQPGQPWSGAGAEGQGQVQEPKKKGLAARLGGAAIAVVVALVVAALIRNFTGGPSAEVGDCLNAATDEIGVVDCDDSEAAFRVLGVVEDTTQASLSLGTVCTDSYPSATNYAFEGSSNDDEGIGYCLEPLS